jgi:hypothetical protein
MTPWTLAIPLIQTIVERFIPDKDKANELAHEVATLAENHAHEIAKQQIEVNQQEAAHKSLFVAGWRPFIGWTCGVAMANNFVFMPYLAAFFSLDVPMLDMSEMMPVLMGMLGLGAYRSYEKVKGVARNK